jgi:hypothetical protein
MGRAHDTVRFREEIKRRRIKTFAAKRFQPHESGFGRYMKPSFALGAQLSVGIPLTSGDTHIIFFIDRGGEKPEIIPFEPEPGNAGGGRE